MLTTIFLLSLIPTFLIILGITALCGIAYKLEQINPTNDVTVIIANKMPKRGGF